MPWGSRPGAPLAALILRYHASVADSDEHPVGSHTAAAGAIREEYIAQGLSEAEVMVRMHTDGMDHILSRQNEAAAHAVSQGGATLAAVMKAASHTLGREVYINLHRGARPDDEAPSPPPQPSHVPIPGYDYRPVDASDWLLHDARVFIQPEGADPDSACRRPGLLCVAHDSEPPYIFTVAYDESDEDLTHDAELLSRSELVARGRREDNLAWPWTPEALVDATPEEPAANPSPAGPAPAPPPPARRMPATVVTWNC